MNKSFELNGDWRLNTTLPSTLTNSIAIGSEKLTPIINHLGTNWNPIINHSLPPTPTDSIIIGNGSVYIEKGSLNLWGGDRDSKSHGLSDRDSKSHELSDRDSKSHGLSDHERIIRLGDKALNYNCIDIGPIDLIQLQNKVKELETIVNKQKELIEALWYRPGMPGYDQACWGNEIERLEDWKVDSLF